MSTKTVTIDDLTGAELTGAGYRQYKVTFDGKAHTLDLSDASAQAVAAFLSGGGGLALVKVMTAKSAVRPARRRTSDISSMRAWLREHHPELGVAEKGRIKPEHKAIYTQRDG